MVVERHTDFEESSSSEEDEVVESLEEDVEEGNEEEEDEDDKGKEETLILLSARINRTPMTISVCSSLAIKMDHVNRKDMSSIVLIDALKSKAKVTT